jgi:hypothetical protein
MFSPLTPAPAGLPMRPWTPRTVPFGADESPSTPVWPSPRTPPPVGPLLIASIPNADPVTAHAIPTRPVESGACDSPDSPVDAVLLVTVACVPPLAWPWITGWPSVASAALGRPSASAAVAATAPNAAASTARRERGTRTSSVTIILTSRRAGLPPPGTAADLGLSSRAGTMGTRDHPQFDAPSNREIPTRPDARAVVP